MTKKETVPCEIAIKAPEAQKKTIIVVGGGRGGTSAIAGCIHILGVRMLEFGTEEAALNAEDIEILKLLEKEFLAL